MTAHTIVKTVLDGIWILSIVSQFLTATRGPKWSGMFLYLNHSIKRHRLRHFDEPNSNPFEWSDYKEPSMLKVCFSWKPVTLEAWFPKAFLDKLNS